VIERAVCYAIDERRSADVLERLIGIDWAGKMTHDGMASYDRFEAALHQQCVGHILRRVRELEATATGGAVHYPRKLIALFTEAIHLRNRHLRGEVSAEQLQEARERFETRLEKLAWPAREVPAYETLSKHLSPKEIAARVGKAEFAVIVLGSSPEELSRLERKIAVSLADLDAKATFSCGWALCESEESLDAAYQRARKAAGGS
jgi:hypothetical protein